MRTWKRPIALAGQTNGCTAHGAFAAVPLHDSQVAFRQLAAAVEHSGDSVFMTDRSGIIQYVNPAFERLTGYAAAQAIGQTPRLLKSGQHDHAFYETLWRTISAGEVFRAVFINRKQGGELFYEDKTISPIRDEQGRMTHFVSTGRDITSLKQTETELLAAIERLRRTHAELEAAQQQVIQQERLLALGELAAGVAHDFNNALVPIIGYSELLLARPQALANPSTVREYVRLIQIAATSAAETAGRLREFSRLREPLSRRHPVDLARLAEEAVALSRPKWKDLAQAEGRTIDVDVEPAGDAPQVLGDEAELREALINLLFNAVEALPRGGTIALRTRSEQEHAVLEVSDDGVGMPEEVRTRCFEPFFSTRGRRGTGLGLSTVYTIVQRHGGAIDVRSAPGEGTTFSIWLPLVRTEEPPAHARLEASPPRPASAPRPAPALHVLVVDDEPAVREVVAACLAVDGHEVELAGSGNEALARLESCRFDLLITDMGMPEMTGEQLAATVRRRAPVLPIILLTGWGEMMRDAKHRPAPVDLVLSKPTTLEALRSAVAQVTSRSWDSPG